MAKIWVAKRPAFRPPSMATVAIEGGINAALLATQILAINNTELTNKLKTYRSELHDLVVKKDQRLKDIGAQAYLEKM